MSNSNDGSSIASRPGEGSAVPRDPAERYHYLCQHGRAPTLAGFLAQVGELTPDQLGAVLRVDQRLRWRRGERPLVEEYFVAYPALASDPDAPLDLIYSEVMLREERGERPMLEEYQRRFPHLESALEQQFAMHQALAGMESEANPVVSTLSPTTMIADPRLTDAGPVATYITDDPEEATDGTMRIAGYELQGELGRGGMGVVYKARQIQLNRIVALKMLHTAGPHHLARFRTEAESVARLQHPNIVQIYEIGTHGGRPFFSLEYCPGGSLKDRIDGEPVGPMLAARIVEVLATAMHAAHHQQIIHRDLKPANILLTSDWERALDDNRTLENSSSASSQHALLASCLKIADFGLAKKLDDASQTRSGMVMGSPAYMSPEQAQGNTDAIGPLTDVYALGTILYELLTGRPPFRGPTVAETITLVLTQDPVAPRQLQPRTPSDLETICLKCLEKNPARRYASCLDLAEDLRRWLNREPIRARASGWVERVHKWARRKPAHAGVAGMMLVLVLGILAFLGQQAHFYKARFERDVDVRHNVSEHRRIARAHEEQKDWLAARAEVASVLDVLKAQTDLSVDDLVQEFTPWLATLEARVQEQQRLAEVVQRRQKFQTHRNDALFYDAGFTGLDTVENRGKTLAALRAALGLYGLVEPTPTRHPDLVDGDLREQCFELLLALADVEATGKTPRTDLALGLLERAASLDQHLADASHVFRVRQARYRSEPEPDLPARLTLPLDWFLVALERYRQARFDDSLQACGEVLRRDPRHFWAEYLRGVCELRSNRWHEARSAFTLCLERRPDFAWPRVLRGFAVSELAFKASDAAEFLRAREDFDAAAKTDDARLRYTALVNRGVLFLRQRLWIDATADLEAATYVQPDGFQAYLNLAHAYQGKGRMDDALKAFDAAIERAPRLALLYDSRARMRLARSDWTGAEVDLKEAIALDTARSARVVACQVELGKLLQRKQQHAEALGHFAAALALQPDHALAERLRAESLLALQRPREAGDALDRFFALSEDPTSKLSTEGRKALAEAYQARGLIHAQFRQYSSALDMYTLALRIEPEDLQTRLYRGWTYLLLDAAVLARQDFDAFLTRFPQHAEALCGRGRARVRLRQLPEALADAERAAKVGPLTDRLHYHLACLHAQLALHFEADSKNPLMHSRALASHQQAVEHLQKVLELLPADRRSLLWREQVQQDPALAGLRRTAAFTDLALRFQLLERK